MKTLVRHRASRIAAAVALAATAGLVTPAVPAIAEGGTPLVLEGTASLPTFPCPRVIGVPDCEGTFAGTLEGVLAGSHLGNAWSVTIDQADVSAVYAYSDGNCIEGSADGVATVTADTGNVIGTYGQGDEEGRLPRVVNGLTATADFTWVRDGTTAHLFPVQVDVSINIDGIGWREVLSDTVGAGTATFTPELEPDDMPDCVDFTNRPAVDAAVTAVLTLADRT